MAQRKKSRLQVWREKNRLRQDDVAGLSGFSAAMISLVESGQRNLSREGKVILARRLGVSIAEIFEPEPLDEQALVS